MQQLNVDNLIIIDIETASEYPGFQSMNESWKELWEEKVSRSLPADTSAEAFYSLRAGVMAEFARIVCISIGYFNRETRMQLRVKSFYAADEKELLQDFLQTLDRIGQYNSKWCFAGHNIKEFDIPFICRRLLIHGMCIPPYLDFQNMKPWETNIVDTFQYWRFGDYKNFTSLKLLAAALNVPSSKDDIDGSMVGPLYWTGNEDERKDNLERIVVYCQKDIGTTANIILRFKNMAVLQPGDITIVRSSEVQML